MRRVVVESPYAGDVGANTEYLRRCLRDCLMRQEAPFASHGLYTQPNVLDDSVKEERKLGMEAGWSWIPLADAVVVYCDNGVNEGMLSGTARASQAGKAIEYRALGKRQPCNDCAMEGRVLRLCDRPGSPAGNRWERCSVCHGDGWLPEDSTS